MKKRVVVLDADEEQCRDLCILLEGRHYRAVPMHSLPDLEKHLQENECLACLFDFDTVPLDNRVIRQLTVKNPGIVFLGLSKSRFHPDLKESICYHLYACINKPIDIDELFYWLKCIEDDAG
jgi:DNA-binding NtrC family response regulator